MSTWPVSSEIRRGISQSKTSKEQVTTSDTGRREKSTSAKFDILYAANSPRIVLRCIGSRLSVNNFLRESRE